ncbi:MAG: cobyric acid synthase [Rhodospirillaceae bacterium]|jgi:adenosylcobyric acid synthase|nr:cobyric acid synthase [Rhodospirillaceae bacterium]MBT4588246.1 cobyric acid synthase [Rhodospirillaceae bacterium]MBT4938545.1 cobyric acid synthase [Rhodospirillaceae bacterium]MBT5941230.1 cobyric acid synthase [Rhodospirillaceae bacterium]MBT7265352.1 cobyric acid synthase [Rhodospirillaceae bacterium]
MFQGTGSDVGKSLVVAGLCRALVKRGMTVRPFKPQNMSNNAAVTSDGGEIGRAQALQAKACGVAPHIDMNPVLLKPQSDVGAQLVVMGKVEGNYPARDYQAKKIELLPVVVEAARRLKLDADIVLIEGAGSAAEINLRENDIANMGFATATKTPVMLVADIDRGGVIASVVGTWELLPAEERALIVGYVINKFRGDVSLFESGIEIIGEKTGLKCFGVIPYVPEAAKLPQEDAHTLENTKPGNSGGALKIAVPKLAHISNFDDFDPLIAEPDIDLQFIPRGDALPGDADLIILPGSKTTIADLADLRRQGWDIDIAAHLRRGGKVFGICAGFQMLGQGITDPEKSESDIASIEGLGHLGVATEMGGDKSLVEVAATSSQDFGSFTGYEMHIGKTIGPDSDQPFATIDGRPAGAISKDGQIMGCYLHGLFADDVFRHAFLDYVRPRKGSGLAYDLQVEEALDVVAAAFEEALDIDGLISAAG